MALTTNAAQQDWRILVEIELTGLTLKIAEEYMVFDDGSVYEGRLRGIGAIFESAGQILAPKVQTSRNHFEVDNSDAQYTTHFSDYTWRNRTATIKVGQGLTIADYETRYIGRVLVSGGVEFDENTMRVNLTDPRNENAKTLPINKFFTSTYPNLEEKAKFQPIPYVYGDFSAGAGDERVPAFQIDSTVGTGGSFKWADHAVKDLESVWKRSSGGAWSSVAFSSEDNSDATFTLDVTYDPDVDEISVHGKGATDDGTETGNLLQTLPDIVDDILQTHLGVASGSIDSTAFSDWEAELTVADYGRRWIGAEISSNTLITEALVEGFADMTIQDGKYFPVYRIVPLTSLTTMREADVLTNRDGTKKIKTASDPEETYLNEVAGDYARNPLTNRYTRYEKVDSTEQSDAGIDIRRRMKMNWLYLQAGAESRAERELFFFARETEIVSLTLGPRAITFSPTDLFRLVYAQYVEDDTGLGVPFQIRQIDANFKAMAANVVAWNFHAFAFGRWTADTATTWLLSTATERAEQGYWTDSSGYADTTIPPDEDSKDSIWI